MGGTLTDRDGFIKKHENIGKCTATVDEKVRSDDLKIGTAIGKNHKGTLLTVNGRGTGATWTRLLGGKDANLSAKAATNAVEPFRVPMHN